MVHPALALDRGNLIDEKVRRLLTFAGSLQAVVMRV